MPLFGTLCLSKALEIDQHMLVEIPFQSLHAVSEKYFLEKMVSRVLSFRSTIFRKYTVLFQDKSIQLILPGKSYV